MAHGGEELRLGLVRCVGENERCFKLVFRDLDLLEMLVDQGADDTEPDDQEDHRRQRNGEPHNDQRVLRNDDAGVWQIGAPCHGNEICSKDPGGQQHGADETPADIGGKLCARQGCCAKARTGYDGGLEDENVPLDAGLKRDCRQPGEMHGADRESDDRAAERHAFGSSRDEEAESAPCDRDETGDHGQADIVCHRHGRSEGKQHD